MLNFRWCVPENSVLETRRLFETMGKDQNVGVREDGLSGSVVIVRLVQATSSVSCLPKALPKQPLWRCTMSSVAKEQCKQSTE
jgi:hypothetical protein